MVSIVMPVRNAMPFLPACLNSIRDQSIDSWELIAVNDHSEDSSLHTLSQVSILDPRIHVFSNKGHGIIPALQLAYKHAQGQYITRMDADDIMSPNKLEQFINVLKTRGPGHIAVGQVKYFSESPLGEGYKKYEAWLNKLTLSENNYADIYKECVIPSPSWMMYKIDFEKVGGFDSNTYPEDYDLCFRLYAHKIKIAGVNEVVHYWRDHAQRSSRIDPNYTDNRFLFLKVSYFLHLDYNAERPLILWGAGKKGKGIAKLFTQRNIPFRWITNNVNKIGHNIYGIKLEYQDVFSSIISPQVIIAIANPIEWEEAVQMLQTHGKGVTPFSFC